MMLPGQLEDLSSVRNKLCHGGVMIESQDDVHKFGRVRTLCDKLLLQGSTD